MHPLLLQLFERLEQTKIRYCVVRGYEELDTLDDQGDVDLLVDPDQNQPFHALMAQLNFVRLPSWGHAPHQFFVAYDEASDRWLDSLGAIEVPADHYWGAQTERSRAHFRIGAQLMPAPLIEALVVVKKAAALANRALGELDPGLADAIVAAADDVLDAALELFVDKGLAATRSEEVAQRAGVSKGTLYVYFADKNCLFEAIVEEEAIEQGRDAFNFDPARDIETTLREFGRAYIQVLCRPGGGSAIRTVMSIAERMPEVGSRFYENVLARTVNRFAAYLDARVKQGEIVGLLGPNGAGKTTSFYMIVGLVRTDGGDITIDGKSVHSLPIHRRSRLA